MGFPNFFSHTFFQGVISFRASICLSFFATCRLRFLPIRKSQLGFHKSVWSKRNAIASPLLVIVAELTTNVFCEDVQPEQYRFSYLRYSRFLKFCFRKPNRHTPPHARERKPPLREKTSQGSGVLYLKVEKRQPPTLSTSFFLSTC